jgi:nitrate reductase delta subunit
MKLFKLLSLLLDYPDDDSLAGLRQAVEEAGSAIALVGTIDAGAVFSKEEHVAVGEFIDELLALDATEIKARYVQTFDLVGEHSLHLTHHIFGEEKTRGPALIDLSEYLKSYGFKHEETELPDFLPLILEFISQLDESEATVFLGDASKVLKVIAANLDKANSPYAKLIHIIDNHGSLIKLAA